MGYSQDTQVVWQSERPRLPAERLLAVCPAVETFLQVKRAALEAAIAKSDLLKEFALLPLLDLCRTVVDTESKQLIRRVSGLVLDPHLDLDSSMLVNSVIGLTRFGRDILKWFETSQSKERADQLLTWLLNSGDSVWLYAKTALKARQMHECGGTMVFAGKGNWNEKAQVSPKQSSPSVPMVAGD